MKVIINGWDRSKTTPKSIHQFNSFVVVVIVY